MSKDLILIVDDHKDFRETIRSFIQKRFRNVDIKEAETGEEGVALALRTKPDIGLIDFRLPGIDGIETARRVREKMPACKIILMSMFKQNALQDLINNKVINFVNKDEMDSELLPLLNKFLDGHEELIAPSSTQSVIKN